LITNAACPGEDISIYEVTKARYISDPIVKRIWANPIRNSRKSGSSWSRTALAMDESRPFRT